jgi:hypothetical protein
MVACGPCMGHVKRMAGASGRKALVECARAHRLRRTFGPVMPTVQLVAKPVLLSTYIYLENGAKLAAIYRHLGLPRST